jgi:hypothetical protein
MSDSIRMRPTNEPIDRETAYGEVVEVPLLLPGWQVSALETAAHHRGLTAGEMLRSVLRDFITTLPAAGPSRLVSIGLHGEGAAVHLPRQR